MPKKSLAEMLLSIIDIIGEDKKSEISTSNLVNSPDLKDHNSLEEYCNDRESTIVAILGKSLVNVLSKTEQDKLKNCIIVETANKDINASATRFRDGGYEIAVNSALVTFCFRLNRLFFHTFDMVDNRSKIRKRGWNFEKVKPYLINVVKHFLADDYTQLKPLRGIFIEDDLAFNIESIESNLYENAMMQLLVTSSNWIIRFVIAHEMAHIILGHSRKFKGIQTDFLRKAKCIDIHSYSQDQLKEFEADLYAFDIVERFFNSDQLSLLEQMYPHCHTGTAFDTFFSDIQFLEKALSVEEKGNQGSDHPPSGDRQMLLREYIEFDPEDDKSDKYHQFILDRCKEWGSKLSTYPFGKK